MNHTKSIANHSVFHLFFIFGLKMSGKVGPAIFFFLVMYSWCGHEGKVVIWEMTSSILSKREVWSWLTDRQVQIKIICSLSCLWTQVKKDTAGQGYSLVKITNRKWMLTIRLLMYRTPHGTCNDNQPQMTNKFKEWVYFFWVHGEWIVARDKQIAWTAKRFSDDLFFPRYDSFPMNPEKKTLISYIHNASN